MTLHLTPAEWAAIEAAGSGVLFRAAEYVEPHPRKGTVPPAEFVEAAKPCELCDPRAWVPRKPDLPCGDCIDGRRRIAAVVPCDQQCDVYPCRRTDADCSGGLRTVGHVVVEWGPWLVVESWVGARANPHKVACLSHNGFLDWHWSSDDLTLVGQYAIGVEVVTL